MIISPFEANQFFQSIGRSKVVALHLFTAHMNKGHPGLNELDLFTIPLRPNLVIYAPLIAELLNSQSSFTQQLLAILWSVFLLGPRVEAC